VALLAARKADVEALTFLSEDDPRQAPADTAAQAGHLGIAAFLGELQLQQAVQRLRDGRENDRGKIAGASVLITPESHVLVWFEAGLHLKACPGRNSICSSQAGIDCHSEDQWKIPVALEQKYCYIMRCREK
jgi:hypothetical protein